MIYPVVRLCQVEAQPIAIRFGWVLFYDLLRIKKLMVGAIGFCFPRIVTSVFLWPRLEAQQAEEDVADDGADDRHRQTPYQQLLEQCAFVLMIAGTGNAEGAQRGERRGIDQGRTDVD